jgi:hypothetical protein
VSVVAVGANGSSVVAWADGSAGVAGVAAVAGVAGVAGIAAVPVDGSAGVAGVAGVAPDDGVAGIAGVAWAVATLAPKASGRAATISLVIFIGIPFVVDDWEIRIQVRGMVRLMGGTSGFAPLSVSCG